MNIDLRSYRGYCLAFVMFVFMHSLQFFDYMNLNMQLHGLVTIAISFLLVVFAILAFSKVKMAYSKYYLVGLIIVPMLSFISCYLERGQSPIQTLRVFLETYLVLVYFVLHAARIRENDLVNAITIVAIVRILILIIQQVTYPYYLFSFRPEGMNGMGYYESMAVRSGIYRFYIEDTYLSMFLVFYYLQQYIKLKQPQHLALLIVGIIGVYLDQSRQFMISTVLAMGIVMLFSVKNRKPIIYSSIILGIFVVFWGYKFFNELLEMTINELNDDRNIRILSLTTYLLEFWGGPLTVIFGNGPAHGASAYGAEFEYMTNIMHMYRSDVGIIGALNLYGIASILFLFFFFIKFVFGNWRKLDIHLKMYFLAMLINLPLVTIYTQMINWFVFMALMLYLSDISIARFNYKEKCSSNCKPLNEIAR